VNRSLAERLAHAGELVGLCLRLGDDPRCIRIVGLAEDHRFLGDPVPMLYLAREQDPDALDWGGPHLLIRTRDDPADALPAIRAALQGLRPGLPFLEMTPLEEVLAPAVRPHRLGALVFGLFGAFAVILAALGLYGVLSYFVGERRPELGIRRSLGARESDVVGLVLRQGLGPLLGGTVLGLGAALFGARFLASLLFGVPARDPLTFLLVAACLVGIGLVASYLPASRAAAVDPMQALRGE
jgi:putative ABC transport system permease protein